MSDESWILEILVASRVVRKLLLDMPEIVIGRSPKCEIHLPTSVISRRHARLLPRMEYVTVQDLDSSNGVFVRGKAIDSHRLYRGDLFVINPYTFLLERMGANAEILRVSEASAHGDESGGFTGYLDPDVRRHLLEKYSAFDETLLDLPDDEEEPDRQH